MKKVVLNIGHSSTDSGAVSLDGDFQEHSFNRDILGPAVKKELEEQGFKGSKLCGDIDEYIIEKISIVIILKIKVYVTMSPFELI